MAGPEIGLLIFFGIIVFAMYNSIFSVNSRVSPR